MEIRNFTPTYTLTAPQSFGAVPLSELAPKVEAELARRAAQNDKKALKALFSHGAPLIELNAWLRLDNGLTVDELKAAGREGLWRAA